MRSPGLIRLVVVLSVAVVMGRLCVAEFTWYDDPATVHQNPSMNPPTMEKLAGYWTAWGPRAPLGLYIPMTYTTWGAMASIAYMERPDEAGIRLNPWVFHTGNVVFHALSALTVLAILRRMVKHDWGAGFGALLFALHPVQVEAVGWVSGTKDVLSGLLSLMATWQYLSFAVAETPRRWIHYMLATVALVAAMLSKPTAMVVPLVAFTLDWLILRRSPRQAAAALAPWLALSVLCMVSAKLAQPAIGVPVAPHWARPMIAMDSLAFYLFKLFWPVDLVVVYGRTPIRVFETGWFYVTWLAPTAIIALSLALRRRHPALLAGVLIFIIGVAPVLGFVPFLFQFFSGVADHYLYPSMLGPALAGAYLVSRVPTRPVAWICVAIITTFSVLSFRQGGVWRDEVGLWEHNLRVSPDSPIVRDNLGAALCRVHRYESAEQQFRESIRLDPDNALAHDNLAMVLVTTGRPAEALPHIAEVLRINQQLPDAQRPKLDRTHEMYGAALMSRGDYERAVEQFRAALEQNPSLESARQNLHKAEAELARRAATTRSSPPATAPQ